MQNFIDFDGENIVHKQRYKLAFDARPAQGRASGVVTYTRNLIRAMPAIAHRFDFLFIVDDNLDTDGIIFPESSEFLHTRVSRQNRLRADILSQWTLPRRLTRAQVDVFHQPDYLIPVLPVGFILVASFLDAIVFTGDDDRKMLAKARVRWFMKKGAKNADAIVTISEYSRRDLMKHLQMDESRLVSLWCGVGEEFFTPPGDEETRACLAKLDINSPFILYYGGFSSRKNVSLLIRAFGRMAGFQTCKLVIAGQAPPDLKRLIAETGLEKDVVLFGYAEDTELRVLLKACRLFVFPSNMEGFGLPVAEAMACGTVVVCSRNGSLPEIAANAVLYFDQPTPESLAAAIEKGLADNSLREDLKAKARKRAQLFDWTKAVEKLGRLYLNLLEK